MIDITIKLLIFVRNYIMYSIYKITNPKGKVYVGQSKNVVKRLLSYRSCQKEQALIYNSIVKYGYVNHSQEIFKTGLTFEEANIEEISLIKFYKKVGSSLNISDGGQLAAYTRIRSVIKFSIDGNLLCEYTSVKDAAESEGLTSANIIHALKDKTYYAKGFLWIYKDDYLKGVIPIWKAKLEGKSTIAKQINQFDLDGKLIATHNSCEEAAKFANVLSNAIAGNVRGITSRVGIFIFSTKDEVNKYWHNQTGHYYCLQVYDLNDKLVGEYSSVSNAARHLGINVSTLYNWVKGISKKTKYRFKIKTERDDRI